jgi:hypothetical protein
LPENIEISEESITHIITWNKADIENV